MLWAPSEPPVEPRIRTPRTSYKGQPTFRARLLPLFDHVTAVNAFLISEVFDITPSEAVIRLSQLVTTGDLVRVRVHARRHRSEFRRLP